MQVIAIGPDPQEATAPLRERIGCPFPILSDEDRKASEALCGDAAHCELLLDGEGVVRWAAYTDSWREVPSPRAVLQAGYRLP